MDSSSSTGSLPLPAPLRLFLFVCFSLTALCILVEIICVFVFHLHYPYNWPLTPPDEIARDLKMFHEKFARFHHADFFAMEPGNAFAYPAPMAVLYELTYLIHGHRTTYFMLVMLCLVCGATFLVTREAIRSGLERKSALLVCGGTMLISYPFFTEAKQGNLELAVWVLVSCGVWLFLRDRGYSSAVCFAVAGSMKIFPLIYLGLHLSKGRWKPFFFGLIVAITVTVLSLWLLVPDIPFAWSHIQAGMSALQTFFILGIDYNSIGFDHSLFSLTKRLWIATRVDIPLSTALRYYMIVMASAGFVIFFTRIRKLPVANQVLALSTCAILFPPLSYDYTLIHLYPPLTMLMFVAIAHARHHIILPGLRATFVLIAACVAPLSELIFHGVGFGGQVRAVLLALLLIVALLYPFPAQTEALEPSLVRVA